MTVTLNLNRVNFPNQPSECNQYGNQIEAHNFFNKVLVLYLFH